MRRIYLLIVLLLSWPIFGFGQANDTPSEVESVLAGLRQAQWRELEEGLSVIRIITPAGLVITAHKISLQNFEFDVVTQAASSGSRAQEIGEQEGAVLVSNAGFFAVTGAGELYSIGYLRLKGLVQSKGWKSAGGTVTFGKDGLKLLPTHQGIPQNEFDVLQSKPMLIEPDGKWAMGSNSGAVKLRTILCTMPNGDVVLSTITRVGLTLFESGWLMRSEADGGFFGCDSAIALDGGRSTQIWHSGEPQYSYAGGTPVHNFLVVRQRQEAD